MIFNGQIGSDAERNFSDGAPLLIPKDAHSLVSLEGRHIDVLSDVSIIHPEAALVLTYCSSFLNF